MQSNGKNHQSHTRLRLKCATSLFLPHFDVIFDLLLNTHRATWNLFVKYYIVFTILLNASLCRSILNFKLVMLSILVGLHYLHYSTQCMFMITEVTKKTVLKLQ